MAKRLQPQVMLPIAAGGDVVYEGLLVSLLRGAGTVGEFRSLLQQNNLSTWVIEPKAGEPFELQLEKRALV